ncbi:universal stress protein [Arenibaculum sp.]|jgi:nucleotide-binding universal stress UspA family protein|uniref:universal stress protein n=1 Tax=Arenibaculum sp. TaxID=2865862 RepID=UPI002E1667D6|nr:universal stress protein [Arenibaculum sp.]
MLSVLIPVEDCEMLPAVLGTGMRFARRYGAYVEGAWLRPDPTAAAFQTDMGAAPVVLPDLERETWEAVAKTRDAFREALAAHGLGGPGPGPELGRPGMPASNFRSDAAAGDADLARYARLFDVAVLGQPDPRAAAPRRSTFETVLFESGRPVLLAPPVAPETIGDTVVVAWNGSTETARTLAFARPLLQDARRIVILSVEGGMVDGPEGTDVVRALRRVGLNAEARHVAGDGDTGRSILRECRTLGADLLIKGAYTQSRLRQMIFGGATSLIIQMAHLPVLMAH